MRSPRQRITSTKYSSNRTKMYTAAPVTPKGSILGRLLLTTTTNNAFDRFHTIQCLEFRKDSIQGLLCFYQRRLVIVWTPFASPFSCDCVEFHTLGNCRHSLGSSWWWSTRLLSDTKHSISRRTTGMYECLWSESSGEGCLWTNCVFPGFESMPKEKRRNHRLHWERNWIRMIAGARIWTKDSRVGMNKKWQQLAWHVAVHTHHCRSDLSTHEAIASINNQWPSNRNRKASERTEELAERNAKTTEMIPIFVMVFLL